MSADIKTFRRSADAALSELREAFRRGDYRGAVVVWMDKDGEGHLRIVGFDGKDGVWLASGLLQWPIADLMSDLLK